MFSPQTIQAIISIALLLHAVAHAIALGALLSQSLRGPSTARVAMRTWLFPALAPRAAAGVAIPFWLVATLGFLAASMVFDDILAGGAAWRQIAVAASLVSILGLALFFGIWPGSPSRRRSNLNTSVALAMNTIILASQLWLHCPPLAMFGK